jgi:hypothetical protein
LYQTKKLDLPGIGSFTLDPATVLPEESDKGMHTPASGIIFSNTNIKIPDNDLISFLQLHTGKMKSLTASDLDFFLTTGRQLLNIGKIFYLDGIGTLVKNNQGKLDFTPGDYSTERLDEPGPGKSPAKKEAGEKRKADSEQASRGYEPRGNSLRQLLLLAGIIGGLAIIGWGGYTLYKKNTLPEPQAGSNTVLKQDSVTTRPDTANRDTTKRSDSVSSPAPTHAPARAPASVSPAVSPSGAGAGSVSAPAIPANNAATIVGPNQRLYKFVILETYKKGRALRRYNQLLGFQLNIKLYQKDSSYFKLYFPIAATIRDTSHIKDSLQDVYAAHVSIER